MSTSQQIHVPLSLQDSNQQGWFYGYASIFNVIDQQRELVKPGAFIKTLEEHKANGTMPKMLWQHNPDKPIGVWTKIYEDNKGLYVEGRLLLDVKLGMEAYSLIRNNAIAGLSIGFKSNKVSIDTHKKARIIHDLDLHEVSLVTFAANPLAFVHQQSFKKALSDKAQSLKETAQSIMQPPLVGV